MKANTGKKGFSSLLFGKAKTRQAILSLLYGHTDESYYLRQIVRTTGFGLGPIERELKQIEETGIIRRSDSGHQVYYQADPDSPIFKELKSLITKTIGVADTLRNALAPLEDRISLAFIYGSIARGEEKRQSDIDLLIAGSISFSEVVKALRNAQEKLGGRSTEQFILLKNFTSELTKITIS